MSKIFGDEKSYSGIIWNCLGSLMFGANSFVMIVLVSRVASVEEAGYFGIALATSQILYIIGLFGLSHFQMTDYGEMYSFKEYAVARAIAIGLMLICEGIVLYFFGFNLQKKLYIVILSLQMLINIVGDLYQSLFFQKNRLDLSGSALFFRTAIPLLLFTVLIFYQKNIIYALVAQTIANCLITLYYAFKVAPNYVDKQRNILVHVNVKNIFTECFPLFLSLFFMNLIINAPRYGIEYIMDDISQGYFNMIFIPAQVINLISQFVFKPLLNKFGNMVAENNYRELSYQVYKLLKQIVIFSLLCAIATYLIGIDVLEIVYNKNLSHVRTSLVIVIMGGGVFACCQLFYYLLVLLRKQRGIFIIYSVVLIIAPIVSIGLIKKIGILGGSLTFGVLHLLILINMFVFWLYLRRNNYGE